MAHPDDDALSRRDLLQALGLTGAALALGGVARADEAMPPFTGPGANPHWGSVGPYVALPGKVPMIQLTDRPVQLETPRAWFLSPITPNAAFFVRWHLDAHPTSVDLSRWRLRVVGHVERPLELTLADLLARDDRQEVVAVNQCSGNSRSRFQPRVPGGQWGNGAMGCARWTGVPLRALLADAGLKPGAVQVQLEGLDRGQGPPELGSGRYLKSLDLEGDAFERALVCFGMNGEPLPLLHGFPVRLVVPGAFSTYWVKSLADVRVLDHADDGFWMAKAYRVPKTARGSTTPEDMKAGTVSTEPISTMPVRSFIVTPDGGQKLPVGLPVTARGIAFSGRGAVTRVEVSTDGGATWGSASLGEDLGPFAFRTWSFSWAPTSPGRTTLAVRATDASGAVQTDEPVWNPGGYLWNVIERQEVVVGPAS